MKVRKIPYYLFFLITVGIILGLWTTGALSLLNPVTWRWLALSGYAFPFFLLITMGMLIVWAFLKQWKLLMMTMAGLIVAYIPVSLYCPIHTETEVPEDALHIITYNTSNWGLDYYGDMTKKEAREVLTSYLADCKPDIACLQESPLGQGELNNILDSIIKPQLPYIDTIRCKNHSQLTILSKYPITRKEEINYVSKGNGSGAFWINVNGREVIIINNHLQTMGFSVEDRAKFSDMVHGNQERDTMKQTSHTIFGKILDASCIRAAQAEAIASFIRMHKGTPMIVCGDFNDTPLSYVHRTIAKDMTDCYETTAMGPGFTLSRYGMRVRIDNILCSDHFQPYNCFVDKSIESSDHYPVRCWITFK